jgi:hypothetical protein
MPEDHTKLVDIGELERRARTMQGEYLNNRGQKEETPRAE